MTKVGQFPTDDGQGGKLTYQQFPDLPAGLVPRMWLDASGLSVTEKRWEDKSGNGNHASMQGSAQGYPVVVRDVQNGQSVMRYFGIGDAYHSFNEISDIRTAFWVIAKEPSNWGMLLGHNHFYDFHFGPNNTFFHQQYASAHTFGGDIFISGKNVEPDNATFPSSLSIVSLRSSGNLKANNFSKDWQFSGHSFKGDLGELIFFNTPLSDDQIKQVETYLHHKWNLPIGYEPVLPPIVVSADGVVSSTQAFDYETLSHYPIRVRAMDESGFSIIREVTVSITDVVEDLDKDGVQDPYDPDIDGDGVSNVDELSYGTNPLDPNSLNRAPTNLRVENELAVLENQAVGTVVGRLLADDADGDKLIYSVAGQSFTIEQNGTIRTARLFDHEASASVAITFTGTDPRGGSASASFSVSVNDLPNDLDEDGITNESDPDRDGDGMSNSEELANFSDPDDPSSINHAPVDLNLTGNRQVEENMPAGTVVGRVVANDEDGNDTLSYSLVAGDGDTHNSLFELNSTTGELRTARFFDYETDGESLSVRVQAKDELNIFTEHAFTINLIDSDVFSPISLDANLMLWLDAMDGDTLDRGDFLGDLGTPEDGNETRFWADKSVHHHHAVRISGSPVYESAGLHGLPSIDTSGDTFELLDSNASFDAWDRMTVFVISQWITPYTWGMNLWKGPYANANKSSFRLQNMNLTHNQGRGVFLGVGDWYCRLNGGIASHKYSPILIAFTYEGSIENPKIKIFGNGFLGNTNIQNAPVPSRLYSTPEHPVQFGNRNRFSEMLIFNDAMSDENREKMEGYLGQKWGLLDHFPDSHPYRKRGVTDDPLMILEGSAGRPVAPLSDLDADFNASWIYSMTDANDSNDNELFTMFDPATFDPASLNNLSLWLDAADTSTITADSDGNVSVWADKSGNENNATQVNASQQPIQISNSIKFDGTDDSLSLEHGVLPDSTEPSMVFLVAKCDASSGSDGFLSNGRNGHHGQSFAYRTNGIGSVYFYSWSNDLNAQVEGNNTILKVHVLELSLEDTSVKIFQDGILRGTKTSFVGTQNLGNENGLIGNANGGFLDGKINEIILIKNEPSDEIRLKTEGYLAHKWGIVDQLPISHIAKTPLRTNSDLDYETNSSEYTVHHRGNCGWSGAEPEGLPDFTGEYLRGFR